MTSDDPATAQVALRASALLGDWLTVLNWSARLDPSAPVWKAAVSREVLHAKLELGLHTAAAIELERLRGLASPQTFRRNERRLRIETGRFAAIVEDDFARFRDGDVSCLIPAIRAMVRLRDPRAIRLLSEALASPAISEWDRLQLRIAIAQLRGDHAETLRATMASRPFVKRDVFLTDLARAAAAAGDEAALGRALADAWAGWIEGDGANPACPIAVMTAHYALLRDDTALEAIEDALIEHDHAPAEARALGNHLSLRGRDDDARLVIDRAIALGRSTPQLWTAYLGTFWRDPETTGRAAARARMALALPGEHHLRVLSAAGQRALAMSDIADLLSFNLRSEESAAAARFFDTLRHIRLDPAALPEAMPAAGDGLSPAANLTRTLIHAWMTDAAALTQATLDPMRYQRFRAARRRVNGELRGVLSRVQAESNAQGTPQSRSVRGLARMYRILLGSGISSRLNSAECYADAVEVLRLVLDRVAARQPLSLIRLGDGEGNFLPYPARSRRWQERDQRRVMTTWWGEARPDPAQLDRLTAAFRAGVDRADILGVVPIWRGLRAQATARDATAPGRGCVATLRYPIEAGLRPLAYTSAHIHHDWQVWNLWRELFARVDRVSWISCHDLTTFLWDTHGVRTRQSIRISPEHRHGSLISTVSSADDDAPLFERHDAICAMLKPEPGEVYLVAAGWLGKIYCDVIRSRGGIGLDVGSMADYWIGLDTRAQRIPSGGTLNLSNILLDDALPPIADERARIVGRPDASRSSASGRVNIAGPTCAAALAALPRQRHLLRAIGHPRCGSGYVAGVFHRHGVAIGHERLLADGIASWMRAVRDARPPYGDSQAHSADFDHTIVYLRDPRDALASIMLENAVERSFDFRRQHILRECGIDLCDFSTALDRATASYLHWYDIAFTQEPDAIIRVEDADTAVPRFLATIGRGGLAALPARLAHRDRSAADDLVINASNRKFGRAKPVLGAAELDRMSDSLRGRLHTFCLRHGYDPTWDDARDRLRAAG